MASPFIFPAISSLPPGYDCTIAIPTVRLAEKTTRDGKIRCTMRVFHDGKVEYSEEHVLEVRNGKAVSELPQFHWSDHGREWHGGAGFLELSFRADDGEAMFNNTRV